MITELLTPLSSSQIEYFTSLPANRWGAVVDHFDGESVDLEPYHLAFIGVMEDRGADGNQGCAEGPNFVRNELYQLVRNNLPLKMIDLGNICAGDQLSDSYFALSTVVYELVKANVIPIIIGGSHDLTLAQYKGYQNLEQGVNVVVVDERIDLIDVDAPATDLNFLSHIFASEPDMLMNFGLLGYQSYFVDTEATNTLQKLKFDCYRLGDVRKNMEEVEPVVRDADMMSFDIASIKQSDASGHRCATPNGFYSEEACQIVRYAGLSDRLSSFAIYGYNPSFDSHTQTAQLIAQMVWYFAEGYYNRKNDNPISNQSEYLKYTVDMREGEFELVFWKSKRSERWWLQMPSSESGMGSNLRSLISCSYADYLEACQDELPERWLRAFERV